MDEAGDDARPPRPDVSFDLSESMSEPLDSGAGIPDATGVGDADGVEVTDGVESGGMYGVVPAGNQSLPP